MELRHLKYFVAVADAGHITRAAEQLGLQQPPLSQQIRALETEIGTPLFRRHPKGVALTAAGRELLPHARRQLQGLQALQAHMHQVARGQRGLLSVGFTSSAAAHAYTPGLLRDCRREHPQIELRLSEGNAAELTAAVAGGQLDCALLRAPVGQPEGLSFEVLLSEPTLLALPIDHELAQRYGPRSSIPLSALQGQRLILVRRPGAPGLYATLLTRLQQRGVTVEVVAEVERMVSNLNLVAAGAGLSLVPASMQGLHPGSVAYRALAARDRIDAPLTLVLREQEQDGVVGTFRDLARLSAAKLRPGRAERTPVRSVPGTDR
jgi:DNA-binding transcriptional LysR family regulator